MNVIQLRRQEFVASRLEIRAVQAASRRRSSTFSLEGRLDGLPLRVTFSPAHPLADIFHPPYHPIASQSISRDVPIARVRGVRDRVLHEHRRASSPPSHAHFPSKNQTGFIPD